MANFLADSSAMSRRMTRLWLEWVLMSTTVTQRPVVVGAALIDDLSRPTKMLAARRKAPKSLAGYWEFPGGKVEEDESFEEALVRELSEELGVESRLSDLVESPEEEGWLLGNGMRMHVFLAEITSGEAQPLTEHDRLEWVALDAESMHALEWIPADRPIVDAILAQVQSKAH